jgi:hypothetical protein
MPDLNPNRALTVFDSLAADHATFLAPDERQRPTSPLRGICRRRYCGSRTTAG